MEMKSSPSPCPNTVTVRRNPPRRARPTPHSAAPLSLPPYSSSKSIRSFPIHDILSIQLPDKPNIPDTDTDSDSDSDSDPEKLKVFLRIRPIVTQQKVVGSVKNGSHKNPNKKIQSSANKKKKKNTCEICLKVNDSHSVTLRPPQNVRRTKSEVYQGFSHVFSAESSQREVFEKMVNPLVDDFLKGKSGMLAAMGPSGSGKTHTVFGNTRDPGMVPRALSRIFSEKETIASRTLYLSMFEIYSEGGKGEKITDLSPQGDDIYMQGSIIKGLQEIVISDAQQAENIIETGMLKRSTATTNSNFQSSRSQCIINIRLDFHEDAYSQSCTAILTIVDLAGAEREKRTGNQGARLLESNFINNTSMVFGLCLRSLLEHQKNPKKPFHKHFQNSLLTKYLRDFLEGKKRMALILTAQSGEEDYQDTSYLLRQASPFMNIKFENVGEQPVMTLANKRRTQTMSKTEQAKRIKLNNSEVCMDDEVKGVINHQPKKKELIAEKDPQVEINVSSAEFPVVIDFDRNENKSYKEPITDLAKITKENQIISNFSRALWKVLKEYKNKLEASENKVDSLNQSLASEKELCAALLTELNLMKTSCSCGKKAITEVSMFEDIGSEAKLTNCSLDSVDVHEVAVSVTCLPDCSETVNVKKQFDVSNLYKEEHVKTRVVSSIKDTSSDEIASTSCIVQLLEEQSNEKNSVSCEYVEFAKEDLKELELTAFSNEISGCDTLESAVSDTELLLDGDGISSFVKIDQRQHEEEVETSYVEVISVSSVREKFEDQSNEKVDITSPNVVFDKQEVKDVEERETNGEITGCDYLNSDVSDSEFLVHGENSSSFVKGYSCQHEEEDSNAKVSSSSSSELECFEKQAISDETGRSSVEVISISSDFENFEVQTNEGVFVSSPNIVCDEEEFKEFEEREANEEITVCETLDAGQDSELPCVVVDGVSSSFNKDQPEQEENEVNVLDSPSDLEESKYVGNRQFVDATDAPHQQLVLPKDVIISQGLNACKLSEAQNVQPSQLNPVKPKRRLRPASSVMLKNINILDFDDANEMPKQHGKRRDVGKKLTQGSSSLVRILKQNLHH